MTQSENFKKDTLKKWAPLLESIGVTGSRSDWMSQYTQNHVDFINSTISTSTQSIIESSLLPVVIKASAQTIGLNLVSVKPLGVDLDKLDKIKKEVNSTNRDRKIDSVIDDKEYKEMKVSDHPEYTSYKEFGGSPLMYLDFVYGGITSSGQI